MPKNWILPVLHNIVFLGQYNRESGATIFNLRVFSVSIICNEMREWHGESIDNFGRDRSANLDEVRNIP